MFSDLIIPILEALAVLTLLVGLGLVCYFGNMVMKILFDPRQASSEDIYKFICEGVSQSRGVPLEEVGLETTVGEAQSLAPRLSIFTSKPIHLTEGMTVREVLKQIGVNYP